MSSRLWCCGVQSFLPPAYLKIPQYPVNLLPAGCDRRSTNSIITVNVFAFRMEMLTGDQAFSCEIALVRSPCMIAVDVCLPPKSLRNPVVRGEPCSFDRRKPHYHFFQ